MKMLIGSLVLINIVLINIILCDLNIVYSSSIIDESNFIPELSIQGSQQNCYFLSEEVLTANDIKDDACISTINLNLVKEVDLSVLNKWTHGDLKLLFKDYSSVLDLDENAPVCNQRCVSKSIVEDIIDSKKLPLINAMNIVCSETFANKECEIIVDVSERMLSLNQIPIVYLASSNKKSIKLLNFDLIFADKSIDKCLQLHNENIIKRVFFADNKSFIKSMLNHCGNLLVNNDKILKVLIDQHHIKEMKIKDLAEIPVSLWIESDRKDLFDNMFGSIQDFERIAMKKTKSNMGKLEKVLGHFPSPAEWTEAHFCYYFRTYAKNVGYEFDKRILKTDVEDFEQLLAQFVYFCFRNSGFWLKYSWALLLAMFALVCF